MDVIPLEQHVSEREESRRVTDGWPQDARGYKELVEAYLERLVRYASRRLGNLHDAEDVVQDVLVRAFTDRAKRREVMQVGAYLYRATSNACTDTMRRRQRDASKVDSPDNAMARLRPTPTSPAEAARNAEEAARAERLLQRLPRQQAEAIRLRVFGELSLTEIADMTGCSVNTINSRLRYGFRKLRRLVAREWTS